MISVFLSLGSNLGDRSEYLRKARMEIEEKIGPVLRISSIYETEPWGFCDEHLFFNQVLEVDTSLSPGELLKISKEIESELGRIRGKERYSARTMDIDILFYGDLILSSEELTIPHAQIANRRFVLEPMAEIAPEKVHPVLQKTITLLLKECEDKNKVLRKKTD